MEYIVDGHKYLMSYQELKELYIQHCEMSSEEFLSNLSSALHLACVIGFLKEIPTYNILSDRGIVHLLVHLLEFNGEEGTMTLDEVRQVFKEQLKLS